MGAGFTLDAGFTVSTGFTEDSGLTVGALGSLWGTVVDTLSSLWGLGSLWGALGAGFTVGAGRLGSLLMLGSP